MCDVTVWMRPGPTGKSVGAEARMDDRERRLKPGIRKVGIKLRQLVRSQHSFIDKSVLRKTGDVELGSLLDIRELHRSCYPTANNEQFSFESVLVFIALRDDYLPNRGL
jgi:hypothetical protein